MTQEILKLALEYIEAVPDDRYNAEHIDRAALITAIEEALAQPKQEPVAAYGYCPECGEKGVMRERRPNGNDKCANGHTYPSSKSAPPQPEQLHASEDVSIGVDVTEDGAHVTALRSYRNGAKVVFYSQFHSAPQRTWVGLTDEEIGDEYVRFEVSKGGFNRFEYAVRAIEAKLKEKNT